MSRPGLVGAIKLRLAEANPPMWREPQALPSGLPPVAAFEGDLVPAALRPWVMDIAERMQCPADYVGVAAMVAAGATVGRKIAIRPQERTDWIEAPNLWGCIVGRPGVMKTPAMNHALKPIYRLNALATEENNKLVADHAAAIECAKIERDAARKAMKKGDPAGREALLDAADPDPPALRRYVVNDTSYESLGVVMADNPNGVLAFRDELVSLLRPLDREENAAARGFYLSAWNGTEGYTFDRIMRGHVHIDACCLSLLGGAQPARLSAYLNDAARGGPGDDGLAQRFGLLVWPDISPDWRDTDREPDGVARRAANLVFDRLEALDPFTTGAERDEHDPLPYLRFAPDALAEFRAWREPLERRVRGEDLHPAMASHLSKYRGLVPKLALLSHLIDGDTGPVGREALIRALAWAEYLETHAARAYASVTSARVSGARTILAKIKAGALASPFRARDVHQANWSGLGERKHVGEALDLLTDHDWLAVEDVTTGGRPTAVYTVNPKAFPS